MVALCLDSPASTKTILSRTLESCMQIPTLLLCRILESLGGTASQQDGAHSPTELYSDVEHAMVCQLKSF